MFSQNETSQWYFGYKAGLNFLTNPPSVLTNGKIYAVEGCASISDGNGNLLFYTKGDTVWNKQHQVMANGTGLFANFSITQAALIIKKPGQGSIYYLFTQNTVTANTSPTLIYYSEIDMGLASGNGSVTVKNTLLHTNCNEKMAAVKHCNGTDFWLIAHEFNSPNFVSYLINSTGPNTTPVVSTVNPTETSSVGQMKISPNAKKIGIASNTAQNNRFMIFDFDNVTGIVSNSLSLLTSTNIPYGCEFSADGTKFYGLTSGSSTIAPLMQWDLCVGSSSAIATSSFIVANLNLFDQHKGMQLAQDGKIYLANLNQPSLSVINNPDMAGASCNFSSLSLPISPGISKFCLPTFISSYFRQQPLVFSYMSGTNSACNNFTFTSPINNLNCSSSSYQSLSWNFGDPNSGQSNTSTALNPIHTFTAGGNYLVKLLLHSNCLTDTIVQTINVAIPTLSVAGNFSICAFQSVTLTASGADSYTWSGTQQSASIIVTPSVTLNYTVSGTNALNTCVSSKIVKVTVLPCTGIESYNTGNSLLTVSPNPGEGIYTIDLLKDLSIEIRDLNGIRVFSEFYLAGKHIINIAKYPPGIYILNAKTEGFVSQYRLVKLN